MDLLAMFTVGFIAGVTVLAYWAISTAKREEKNHDRDNQDTQSNQKGNIDIYPVSSEGGAESSSPGSSCNGEPLDITYQMVIYSRNILTQYCNGQKGCNNCCLERNGGCSLISGPPCMWAKKEGEEDVQK